MECILGFFNVIHGTVGELQYKGRSVRDLAKAGIFFYDHFYQLLDHAHSYGILQRQDFLEWNIIDWPIPDGSIIEAYRAKLYAEVQHSLKPNIATRIVKITIFMPINVFVDIFQEFSIKVCKTMFTFKAKACDDIPKFLDDGWNKIMANSVYCEVVHDTINLKYMFASQNFILSFYYKRSRMIGTQLVPMEQDESSSCLQCDIIDIDVVENGILIASITLGRYCTLSRLRNDIINETEGSVCMGFSFILDNKKVNKVS